MGTLKPGATYIYERHGDTVYAREFGSFDRQVIGQDYKSPTQTQLQENQLWQDIRRFAETNECLQSELERVKILYYLLKEDNDILHHSV